jgi:hypothetical protein
MILDRLYRPTENELIYHYCRPEAFLEIVNSRSIWLSASYTLNDVTERSWGYSTFAKAAKTLEREVGSEFINKIAEPVIAGDSHSILMIAAKRSAFVLLAAAPSADASSRLGPPSRTPRALA